MEKATGLIEAVKSKDGKYGIRVDSVWYNGFGNAPGKKGDKVEVEYEINGNFKNVRDFKLLHENKEINPIDVATEKRRILDCVLEVFRKGETKNQNELIEVSARLYKAMEEIYKLNHAGQPALIQKAIDYGAEVVKI